MTTRHRHVWVKKFTPWCRRCFRTGMFACACGEGRCLYHIGKHQRKAER